MRERVVLAVLALFTGVVTPPAAVAVTVAPPAQPPGALDPPERPVRLRPGLYVCGDHRDNASINGALASGRRAADAVLEDL